MVFLVFVSIDRILPWTVAGGLPIQLFETAIYMAITYWMLLPNLKMLKSNPLRG
jgi:hypothetical protein